jgi:hypothetical protein
VTVVAVMRADGEVVVNPETILRASGRVRVFGQLGQIHALLAQR